MLINIGMGEVMSSILLNVGFFLLIHFVKKMLVNIIILILFTGIQYQNFIISKQKKFLPHAGFEPGPF